MSWKASALNTVTVDRARRDSELVEPARSAERRPQSRKPGADHSPQQSTAQHLISIRGGAHSSVVRLIPRHSVDRMAGPRLEQSIPPIVVVLCL